jgi:integral membrane protein
MIKLLSQTWLGKLRIVAFMEGCSYLLFGITMPLKYIYQIKGPNKIIGMAHGVLFVLYILLVIKVALQDKWPAIKTFWAFLASIIPFGTFYADKKLFRYS